MRRISSDSTLMMMYVSPTMGLGTLVFMMVVVAILVANGGALVVRKGHVFNGGHPIASELMVRVEEMRSAPR